MLVRKRRGNFNLEVSWGHYPTGEFTICGWKFLSWVPEIQYLTIVEVRFLGFEVEFFYSDL